MITKRLLALLLAVSSLYAVAQERPAEAAGAAPNLPNSSPPAAEPVLQLDAVVREVLAKNSGVQSALHAYEAKRHRAPQERSLPDPKVGVGWMGNITPFSVQTGDPSSYRSIEAMQEIPFPGKLALRGDMATQEAKAAWWEYEAARRQVVAQVKTAYYEYFFLSKAITITQENKELLDKLSHIAENRYRVGKGIQQDVLKSQTELSLLLKRLIVLEQSRDTARARINTLLSRDPETPLGAPAEVQPAVLRYSLDDLYRLAAENDPGLHREQQMVVRNQRAIALAHKDYLPDFGVGYMYQQRPMMPDMNGFTFTVNVPVFYKTKQREAEKEATEELLAAKKAQDNRGNDVNFGVKQAYLAAKASEDLMGLYSKAVVPQASLALESSMSSYQVGNVDFLSVLANFSNVLDYEIDYYRAVAELQKALAGLEPLVGVELTGDGNQNPTPAPESR
jgi:cobalt-zinc-cadmium efflux system outer membrane protein